MIDSFIHELFSPKYYQAAMFFALELFMITPILLFGSAIHGMLHKKFNRETSEDSRIYWVILAAAILNLIEALMYLIWFTKAWV